MSIRWIYLAFIVTALLCIPVVSTANGGVHQSTEQAQAQTRARAQFWGAWQDLGIHGGMVEFIMIDPTNSNIIYIGTHQGDKIFKSTDGGQSWNAIGTPEFWYGHVTSGVIDPGNANIIYAGHGMGVFKSTDGGASWSLTQSPPRDVCALTIDPSDGQTLYAASGLALHNPTDIYKTDNGGMNWTRLTGFPTLYNNRINAIAVHPGDTDIILAVSGNFPFDIKGDIWRSDDGGQSWVEVLDGDALDLWVNDIAYSPLDPANWYAATRWGVYNSSDGGATWNLLTNLGHVQAIAVSANGRIYAGVANEGIYISDVADPFNWSLTGWNGTSPVPIPGFRVITIDPGNPDVLYVGEDMRCLFKSYDGGATWVQIKQGITANQVWVIETDGTTFYAGGVDGLYRYVSGTDWEHLVSTPRRTRGIGIDPSDQNKILAGFDAREYNIKLTQDGGQIWQDIAVPSDVRICSISSFIFNPNNTSIVYAAAADYVLGTDGGVIKSTDGGYTWDVISENYFPGMPVNTLAMDPQNPDILYAGLGAFQSPEVAGGIYKTIDGGQTWTNSSTGLPTTGPISISSIIVHPNNTQTLLVAVGAERSRPDCIYKSDDGGITWYNSSTGFPGKGTAVTSLAFNTTNPDIIYAGVTCGNGEVYISTNGGATWSRLVECPYQVLDLLACSLYAGTSGGVLKYEPVEWVDEVYEWEKPVIISKYPEESSKDVPIDINITVTFDKSINPLTIGAHIINILSEHGDSISGIVKYDMETLTLIIDPVENLWYGTEYSVTLSGIQDLLGNVLEEHSWSFTTVFGTVWEAIDGHDISVVFAGTGIVNISEAPRPAPAPDNMVDIGLFIEITPQGIIKYANITLTYEDAVIPAGANESTMKLYYWDSTTSRWEMIAQSDVDIQANILYAEVDHLTIFAPMVEKPEVYEEEEVEEIPLWFKFVLIGITAMVIIVVIAVMVIIWRGKRKAKH